MWVKRNDWVKLLTSETEHRVMHERVNSKMEIQSRDLDWFKDMLQKADARVKELEARILEMQDELNQARRLAMKPGPVMLDDSLFEEVEEDVLKIRQQIKEDGADVVLAKQAVDSGVGELA